MTQNKLAAYNSEIQPLLRTVNEFKDALKGFKETDEKALKLIEAIKDAQEELKLYLEDNVTSKDILENIEEHTKEFGLAVKAAARGSAYKVPELKAFFVARSKDDAVEKAVDRGELFKELTVEIA